MTSFQLIEDPGLRCIQEIANHFGREISSTEILEKSYLESGHKLNVSSICDTSEKIGFRTSSVNLSYDRLIKEAPLPCIVSWNNNYAVVSKIRHKKRFINKKQEQLNLFIPSEGGRQISKEEFVQHWGHLDNQEQSPIENQDASNVLLFELTPGFYDHEIKENKRGLGFVFSYLLIYRKLVFQLALAMFFGSIIQLIFPFLTQSVVDYGINFRDIDFIYLILIAQLILFVSKSVVDVIRGWIILYIGTRVNVNLVSDFLVKLMKLPLNYFDKRPTGDILQRIEDHYRIEKFLTGSSINVLFSFFTLLVFSSVLVFYNLKIFAVFFIGTSLYIIWVVVFMKKRKILDNEKFLGYKKNQDKLLQFIFGIQDIKLHNCETKKRWEWERIQASLFKLKIKLLKLNQFQQTGAVFINELKNILITFLAAKSVIQGEISLGMMLSIQYIIGQLNSPIEQMIGFLQDAQDARLSLDRLSDIHDTPDEDISDIFGLSVMPKDKSLNISDLSYSYSGKADERVLKNITCTIPEGKTTAIVGTSGSGKTTLVKLLLKFYQPDEGKVYLGNSDLNIINFKNWRNQCAAVSQEGYIFNESIASNITLGADKIDIEQLLMACEMANIRTFIEELPQGFNTVIGNSGQGLSQGQKQRILIARAVYKNPQYLFFDEATNALDTQNEKIIVANLNSFFQDRTVVVVAHRLSTVREADHILVLEKGVLVEAGNHETLIERKGHYYALIKNQLELGN